MSQPVSYKRHQFPPEIIAHAVWLHVNFFSQAGDPMPSSATELPSPLLPPEVARMLEVGRQNGMEFILPQR